jgi:GNAT superfamily N-acetyltransferase
LPYGPPDYTRYKDTLRIKSYFRVDLGLSYNLIDTKKEKKTFWNKNFSEAVVSLEIFNLLGINNVLSKQWIQDVEPLITNANHWHILEMAVHPRLAGKGIGKLLYHDLFKVANGSRFSGYVATSPYRNDTSIHFHEKMGFKAVANFQAEEFCGLTNYSSTLYFR